MDTAVSTIALGVGPIAALCLGAGLLAGAAQVGFRPHPQALKLDFKRINPLSGARNVFGPNVIFETLKAVAKIAAVGLVAGLALIPGLSTLAAEVGLPPGALGLILDQRGNGDRPARARSPTSRSPRSTTAGSATATSASCA